MDTLFSALFEQGFVSYLMVMLTLGILGIGVLSCIRVILETSLPIACKAIITHYYTTKIVAEQAKDTLNSTKK